MHKFAETHSATTWFLHNLITLDKQDLPEVPSIYDKVRNQTTLVYAADKCSILI